MPNPPQRYNPPYYTGIVPPPTTSPELDILRTDFQIAIDSGNLVDTLSFMDETGSIASYMKSLIYSPVTFPQPLNMWNVRKLKEETLGNWSVPNYLRQLKNLLTVPSPEIRALLSPLYNVSSPWLIQAQEWLAPLMNTIAWEAIVISGYPVQVPFIPEDG